MSDWERATLGEVADIIRGVTYSQKDQLTADADGSVPVVRATDFDESGLFEDTERVYVPRGLVNEQQTLRRGDVLITMSTGSVMAIGKSALVKRDRNEAFGGFLAVARPKDNAAAPPAWVGLLLTSEETRTRWREIARGSAIKNLSQKAMNSLALPLPPLPVQERIVEVIGAVDDQIAALDAEADVLEGVYRAAMSLLWLTSQGDEAEPRSLGDVMHLDVIRTPMVAGTTYHLAGVLNAGKGLVDKEVFDGADTEYTAMNVLRENQVVMRKLTAWEGPITVVPAEFDGFVASNEFPTFTLADDIAPGWMKHVCRTPRLWAEMQSRVVGTVQRRKRLNPDQLLSVALPVPSRIDQEQVAEALDAMEGQVGVIRAEATRLREARAGLLSNVLNRTIEIESAELEV